MNQDTPSKLEELVFHLHWLSNQIEFHFGTIEKVGHDKYFDILHRTRAAAHSMALINLKSLMDEHNPSRLTDQGDRDRFGEFDVIIKPIFKAITKTWPDINVFRNEILAHNPRGRVNKRSSLPSLYSYRVPSDIYDLYCVFMLIVLYNVILQDHFIDEIQSFQNWLDKEQNIKTMRVFTSKTEAHDFAKKVTIKVDTLRKSWFDKYNEQGE